MVRTAPTQGRVRGAGRALALAVLPALLIAGCTSDSGNDDASPDEDPTAAAPTPDPVRFGGLPNACRTLDEESVEEAVPGVKDAKGEELPSADVNSTAICLWSGLDEDSYEFRSLTLTLKRFESDAAIGSGNDRAASSLSAQAAEVTDSEDFQDITEREIEDLGDQAVSISYLGEMEADEGTTQVQQERLLVRVGNVVIMIDYSGAGFQDADLPSAEAIREGAEEIAEEVLAAVEATEGDEGDEDGNDEDDSESEDSED